MKTRSNCIVGFVAIKKPYAQEGIATSNNNVKATITAKIAGEIISLTAAKANII